MKELPSTISSWEPLPNYRKGAAIIPCLSLTSDISFVVHSGNEGVHRRVRSRWNQAGDCMMVVTDVDPTDFVTIHKSRVGGVENQFYCSNEQ